MSRLLYLDTFSGISGDMFLGALVDAGLRLEELVEGLKGLPLDGYHVTVEKTYRGPFQATRLRVHLEASGAPSSPGSSQSHSHAHAHSHSHFHSHATERPTAQDGEESHAHQHHHASDHGIERNFNDITALLARSTLPESVCSSATDVFRRLGEAEARVHGLPLEKVHFHEVGAVDSIVDIVGACLALRILKIEALWCSPVTLGSGLARGSHGTFPLPAPATLEVLRGVPVRQRDSGFELTTPTGAALVSTLARGFGPIPPMLVSRIGYGAGDDRPGEVPNLLRVVIGEDQVSRHRDRVVLLESNIDDMSPQWLGHLMDRLFEAGALDVTVTPVLMKKSRPAHKISVLAEMGKQGTFEELLFRESTTFGIRKQEVDRVILDRRSVTVDTPWGVARVKVGESGGGTPFSVSPEYDDLKEIARRGNFSLKEAHRRVLDLYYRESENA